MVRKLALSILAVLSVVVVAAAQTRQVSGTVKAADGNPVAGATVVVEGTTRGTTTGSDGTFVLAAPADGTLKVSFIGYVPQTIAVAGRTRIDVTLEEDTQKIGDVIVVAYGTTTKEAFTGSASVVKGDELAKRQTGNVMNALTGVVPGLQMKGASGQPGTDNGFTSIRGFSSLNAERDPLIIVDGAPYPGSMANINTADIQSISVLKDAASAALYGARGAAGVILITTKKGTSRDAVIHFDMKIGVNQRATQNYDVISDPAEYYEAYYMQAYNKYYYGDGQSAELANRNANQLIADNLMYNVFSLPAGERLIGLDGKISPDAKLGNRVTDADGKEFLLLPDDWDDEIYRSSVRQEYNMSISGNTERTNYFASLGYLDDQGIIAHSKYTRISARLKADYQAKKWLKIGGSFAYVNGDQQQNNGSALSYAANMAPIYPMYMRDGEGRILKDAYGYTAYDYGNGGNGGIMRPIYRNANPLGQADLNKYQVLTNEFNSYGFAEFTLLEGLKLNIDGNYFFKNFNTKEYVNGLYGTGADQKGQIARTMQNNFSYNVRQTLAYARTFGGDHHFNALLGHEYYNQRTALVSGSAHLMFSDKIQELNAAMKVDNAKSYLTEYNTEGYFASVNYDYANKYYLAASYRRDASSYFHPDHRWGNFWSLGGAWILSKESFMQGASEWLDMLKLKLSYGEQGNDNIGNFMYVDMYNLAASGNDVAASFANKGNPTITWETTGNLNAGVEFSLFRDRLTGSIDYYDKKTTDLLMWVSVPESSGYRGSYRNIGGVRNYGVEIDLAGRIFDTKHFSWDVNFNLAHNTNKITSLKGAGAQKEKGFSESYFWYEEGKSIYNFYTKSYAGVDDLGQAMYWKVNKDGSREKVYDYNSASDIEQGDTLPDLFGGFGTTLRLYGFDLTVTFDYQIGGRLYDSRYASLMSNATRWQDSGGAIHRDVWQSWSPQNTSSNIPRFQYADKYTAEISDRWLTDASYLNLQSINFGYTLPQRWVKKMGLGSMRLYFAAENVWFWSKRQGFDPRTSHGGIQTTDRHAQLVPSGISYAPIRTLSGGLQVTF